MKRSLLFSVTLIFAIAFGAVALSYHLFVKYQRTLHERAFLQRFETVFKSLPIITRDDMLSKELERFKSLGFEIIAFPKEVIRILKEAKTLKKLSGPFGEARLLEHKNVRYVLLRSYGNAILLKDIGQNGENSSLFTDLAFGAIFFTLFLAYVAVVINLRPLKRIERELKKFLSGETDIDLNIKGGSEITEVVKAFNKALQSLKSVIEARELLIRNLMHELKTPITKGRIAAEMVDDAKQKKRLVEIFERLNHLISEISALEQMNSNLPIKSERKRVFEILQDAIDMGMFDSERIETKIEPNLEIKGDRRLLAIAFKNLIDNGLKHSFNSRIKIYADGKRLVFESEGEPLKKDLSYYTKAFTGSEGKGMGLGLYIVDQILKLHGYKLSYVFSDNKNRFIIEF